MSGTGFTGTSWKIRVISFDFSHTEYVGHATVCMPAQGISARRNSGSGNSLANSKAVTALIYETTHRDQ